ncbi:MAG: GTPase HflX [Alphaproteobacteria bacterium]
MNNKDIFVLHPYLKPSRHDKDFFLDEAVNLVASINLNCIFKSQVGLEKISSKTFLNKGYINKLKNKIICEKVSLIFVNTNLSPIQQRNLEKELNCKVIDRTGLILEIFGSRARSNEGKLSVSLASLEFQKSRLVRSWTHLERQRGGAGFMGGPGEKQIESDKRQLTEKIIRLRKKIKSIVSNRDMQRNRRKKNNIPIISLVGYTNSGKSTLFNTITKANVLSKNMLFASLDSTIRRTFFNNINFLFVDTVGFIRELPTTLIDSFKSTLDEIIFSDLIIHVRDISSNYYLEQKSEVLKILEEIGVKPDDNRIIEVVNKIDLIDDKRHFNNNVNGNMVFISALNGFGLDKLKKKISEKLEI